MVGLGGLFGKLEVGMTDSQLLLQVMKARVCGTWISE